MHRPIGLLLDAHLGKIVPFVKCYIRSTERDGINSYNDLVVFWSPQFHLFQFVRLDVASFDQRHSLSRQLRRVIRRRHFSYKFASTLEIFFGGQLQRSCRITQLNSLKVAEMAVARNI